MRRFSALFCFALLVASGGHAAGAQPLAIVELRFADLPPALADPVRLRINATLARLGYQVLESERTRRALREGPPGCILGPCLARVGHALNAERALIGTVAGQGSSYELTFSLLETGGGSVLAQVTQRCDVCNFREVEASAALSLDRLHQQAKVVLAHRSTLTVASVPPGAEVNVDGLPAGAAPVRNLLPPGRHTVQATAPLLEPLRRELTLKAGEIRTLTMNLLERHDVERVHRQPSPYRYPPWVKWIVISGGLAAMGPGAVLIAVDGGATSDGRTVLNTRPAGIALTAAGGTALAAGILLWVLERR